MIDNSIVKQCEGHSEHGLFTSSLNRLDCTPFTLPNRRSSSHQCLDSGSFVSRKRNGEFPPILFERQGGKRPISNDVMDFYALQCHLQSGEENFEAKSTHISTQGETVSFFLAKCFFLEKGFSDSHSVILVAR